MIGRKAALVLAFLKVIIPAKAGAASPDDAASLLEKALPQVRLTRSDVQIRPERWDTRFRLTSVDNLLRDPLKIPTTSNDQARVLSDTHRSSDFLRLSGQWLDCPLPAAPSEPNAGDPIQAILQAISEAQKGLDQAVDSLSREDRRTVLEAWQAVLKNEEARANLEAAVSLSARFDQNALLQSAYGLMRAIDQVLPALQKRSGNSIQTKSLTVHYGRTNLYRKPVAAAGEKEIRVVIDFADDVSIVNDAAPSAGVGRFGIGLLYLPNVKTLQIRTGDFSQGAGLFGVGGLFVKASSATFSGHNAAQGAAVFGAGIFAADISQKARYSVRFGGQGVGFTRGAGIFVHRGNDSLISGGFYYADPREELAFTSLCQGVGYGPRAYAGGGVGLAFIEGDRNHLESSYFAQGAGYWLGYGGFYLLGHDNHVQARRYDQGTGVHTAIGAMLLRGDRNQVSNWAVGPAYGWDYGIGQFTLEGNDNTFRTDWGTGHGDINGLALAAIVGDRNRLALPGFGTGALSRNAPSYGVAVIDGSSNELIPSSGIWGALKASAGTLWRDKIELPTPIWPPVSDRADATLREKKELSDILAGANAKALPGRLKDWLTVASNFGLDSEAPGIAREKLWALSPTESAALFDLVSPDRFDEFIFLRTLLAFYAAQNGAALSKAYDQAEGTRKIQLLGFMAFCRPSEMGPAVQKALKNPDWRVRRSALGVLGYWFDEEAGRTPGRLFLMEERDPMLRRQATEKYLGELLALLALNPTLATADRLALANAQGDYLSPLSPKAWNTYADILKRDARLYRPLYKEERKAASRGVREWNSSVVEGLQDVEPEVIQAALITLGQWGDPKAVRTIRPFLGHEKAFIREGAATALVKLGLPGKRALQKALKDPDVRVRLTAEAGLKQF